MKKFNYSFFIALGLLMLAFGSTTAEAQRRQKTREVPVTYGMISVKTSPESYPVFVNGRQIMSSGIGTANEERLQPGTYDVEVRFPNKSWRNEQFEVRAGKRSCVCLSYKENIIDRPCPSEVLVTVQPEATDGDLVTFSSNVAYSGTNQLGYNWTVTPESARITSGQGTPSITVDTTGLGSQTVTGRLEVVDNNFNDPNCRGENQASIPIRPIPPPPTFERFDEFEMIAFDDVKARLDNYAIELQSRPDWQGYIVVYGRTPQEANRLGARAMDYLVRNRKIDARRLQVVNWGIRKRPRYELYLVPNGASPPPPPNQ